MSMSRVGDTPCSLDLHVRQNASLQFCWRPGRVAGTYDNSQSIFEDPPDALKSEFSNRRSPADSDSDPQYSSQEGG